MIYARPEGSGNPLIFKILLVFLYINYSEISYSILYILYCNKEITLTIMTCHQYTLGVSLSLSARHVYVDKYTHTHPIYIIYFIWYLSHICMYNICFSFKIGECNIHIYLYIIIINHDVCGYVLTNELLFLSHYIFYI